MKIAINNLSQLTTIIKETHTFFLSQVQQQVNVALTLRNWLIGCYIVEYEQNGTTHVKNNKIPLTDAVFLINRLSFSHFIELLKTENISLRTFYETETIKNNWTVRELQRAL